MEACLLGASTPPNGAVDYVPIFLLLLLAVGLAGGQLLLSWVVGKHGRRSALKDSPYECGMEPEGEAHTRFSVKFYLVAVLFILFDIEVVFLYPWAVYFGGGTPSGAFADRAGLMQFLFFEMFVFLAILMLGWYWVVKKRALDWEDA